MSGARGGLGRIVAMGIGLALALLLAGREGGDGRASTPSPSAAGTSAPTPTGPTRTGGAKFRPDAYCATPPGADPFDGAHMKSFTRDGSRRVSGTRYARWRWEAPAGTGITRVRGTWWHALHDGIEQRIGVDNWSGGFDVFAAASSHRRRRRAIFVAGFCAADAGVSRTACSAPAPRPNGAASTPAHGRRCGP